MNIFVREGVMPYNGQQRLTSTAGTMRIIEVEGSDTIDNFKAKIQVPKKLQKIVIFLISF